MHMINKGRVRWLAKGDAALHPAPNRDVIGAHVPLCGIASRSRKLRANGTYQRTHVKMMAGSKCSSRNASGRLWGMFGAYQNRSDRICNTSIINTIREKSGPGGHQRVNRLAGFVSWQQIAEFHGAVIEHSTHNSTVAGQHSFPPLSRSATTCDAAERVFIRPYRPIVAMMNAYMARTANALEYGEKYSGVVIRNQVSNESSNQLRTSTANGNSHMQYQGWKNVLPKKHIEKSGSPYARSILPFVRA